MAKSFKSPPKASAKASETMAKETRAKARSSEAPDRRASGTRRRRADGDTDVARITGLIRTQLAQDFRVEAARRDCSMSTALEEAMSLWINSASGQ